MSRATPLRDLQAAVSFLTVLGPSTAPTTGAMAWFPVVGAGVGGAVGAVWWGAGEIWPPLVAAVIAVVADLLLTGALHHDGLADSADGLLPHGDLEQRLRVMRQPDIGTFAVMALTATTLVRVGALSSIEPAPALLAGIWCAGRTAMVVIARRVRYARSSGLASGFLGGGVLGVVALGTLLAAALVGPAAGWAGLGAVMVVGVAAAAVTALAIRRIGGFTGDVLGAAGLLGETGGLLVLAARW